MKLKDNSLTIIYIAGNGHSGSTLLDLIIGSSNPRKIFSAGELTFITRDSIFDELCSCEKNIQNCEVWSKIFKIWNTHMNISYEEYKQLRNKYDLNKNFINIFLNHISPSSDFITYCENTLLLFKAIKKVTGTSVIVDSSKVAPRIAALSRISNLKIIHICRDFSGVLNSAKRNHKKNIKAGYEADSKPRNSYKVCFDWILNNTLVKLFSFNKTKHVLHYKDYVHNIHCLSNIIEFSCNLDNKLEIKPQHMLAGNALRLKKDIKLNPKIGFKYHRLTTKQKRIASIIDTIFFFWAKK